jgi:eukaryotic-like serine/threonine-protein kinase
VAIKVLPEAFATDPERLARFEREAKTLAALNHPHIAQIYGLERSGGTQALVMELVEGETLADRIARGPIPMDEALPIAKQIAEALEAAHEQGIIHRDLKPANIKVRPDGTVRVLDFGLAKLTESSGSSTSDVSLSPTITSPAMMTGVGVLLGTAAYMAPEQARGKPADKRSDIWAFGAVLYEMVTGRPAFGDEDVSLTLSKVLQRDPEWLALRPDVPPRVQQVLRLCLQKDPKQRAQAIGDVRLALEGAFETVAPQATATPPAPRSRLIVWGPVIGVAVTAVAASLLWILWHPVSQTPRPVARFTVELLRADVGGRRIRIGLHGRPPDDAPQRELRGSGRRPADL